MSQPVLLGAYMAELQNANPPWQARRLRIQPWLRQLRIDPPSEHMDVLAWCDSGPEALLAWQFAKDATANCGRQSFEQGDTELFIRKPMRLYFVDMLLERNGFQLAIEIDGHTFHQLTEEQVQGDYLRQRRLVLFGASVIRFTAREVLRDPAECWRQVMAILNARTP